MNQLFQRFKVLFSGKYAGTFILALCIVCKSLLIFFYSYIGRDKMYHLSASYNLLHGKGWTNSFYYSDQLSKEVPESFCLWPPGYGLLVAPVEYLMGDNLHLSTDIIEIIFFIAFILLCRAILRTQGMSTFWLNISTLLLGFYSHDFIEVSLGTDLPGVCLMLGFFYCSIRLWRMDNRRSSLLLGAIAGFCLFMAGFTRYMYVPVALFAAIFMLAIAYWKNNRLSLKAYWMCLLVCGAGLAAATLYQTVACGSPFYIGTDKKSLFVSNLHYWHPAALGAFLNLNVYATLLERFTAVSFTTWQKVFGWVNLVVYGLILVSIVRFLPKIKKTDAKSFPIFETVGFVLSASLIGQLALLSLTNSPKYDLSGEPWTFIVEGRYHAFPVVFLQLFFLNSLSKAGRILPLKNIRTFFMAGLFLLLCINTLHQFYFTAKVMLNFREMKSSLKREQDYDFAESYIKQVLQENPDKDVLVVSSDSYYPLMGSVLGAKGIKDYTNLTTINSRVHKPTVLLAIIFPQQLDQYKTFTGRSDVKLVREINGTYIYRQDLK